ncbi:carboxypeptidase-like regulatory domain-containing protein [Pseudoalteromonas sp. 23_GOM-1509m]|uniref:carboxypeptidase-like regulatory domain-containing protein n=1 Tax=Pseudoalteromonas sp. 23_GOM-1509m TaxID=1380373 RepID=UPI00048FF1A5|nr:carboxypeptidase-like regulatory domain-containing protein [Pseudoalteromonas sp. 23_GOM-1509m]
MYYFKRLKWLLIIFLSIDPLLAAEPDTQAIFASIKKIDKKWQQYNTDQALNERTEPELNVQQGEGIPEGELLFFSSFVKKNYLGEMLGVKSKTGVLIDLLSFSESLDFAIDINSDDLIAQGWFISEDNQFYLDLNTNTAKINGARYSFNSQQAYAENGDMFVDSNLLAQWFSLDIDIEYSALELNVSSPTKLPIELKREREQRETVTNRESRQAILPWKASPYSAISSPLADVQLSATKSNTDSAIGYSVLGSNDLAYFNTQYFFAGRKQDLLSDSRLSFSRQSKDARLLGPLNATTVQLGDVLATQVGKRFNGSYARGVKVDNKPLFKQVNSNQINLTGAIQPGWDVELYRNDVLLAQQFSLADGRYLFEDIDLLFGANNFELIFYGPQGQVERKTEQYFIDGNSLSADESFYEFSITEQGEQLFNQSLYSTQGKGWQLAGRYETGLTDYLSVYAGTSILNSNSGDNVNNYAFGSNLSIFDKVLLNLDYEKNNNDEDKLEVAARGELVGQSVRLSLSQNNEKIVGDTDTAKTESYQLYTAGKLFDESFGSLSYQNTLAYNNREFSDSYLSVDNTLSYNLGGTVVSNNLIWRKFDSLDDATTLGSMRLQHRFGKTYTRFSVDYSADSGSTILGYQAELSRNLSQNLQSEFTLRNSRINDLVSMELGLNWQSDSFSLNSTMSYDDDDNWRLGLFSRFSIGFDTNTDEYFLSKRSLVNSGTLMVRVFLDSNNNNIQDDGEKGIEGVKVKGVQNYRRAVTNENGLAILKGMPANRTTDIVIEPGSISEPFLVAANDGFSITPRAGFVEYMEIPLNNSSELEGTVYKQDEQGSSEVQPFATIKLLDKQGKQVAQTQAAYDGYYLFTDLRPGEYKAVIDDEFKQRKSLKDTQQVVVKLPAQGEVVMGVDFELKEKTQTPAYIANAGGFSSLPIMKAYYQLIKRHLNEQSKRDAFYIKDDKQKRYILAVAYAESAKGELEQVCAELKVKGLNCQVQAQLISH